MCKEKAVEVKREEGKMSRVTGVQEQEKRQRWGVVGVVEEVTGKLVCDRTNGNVLNGIGGEPSTAEATMRGLLEAARCEPGIEPRAENGVEHVLGESSGGVSTHAPFVPALCFPLFLILPLSTISCTIVMAKST